MDDNKKFWFFGSKLNTVLLLVLIILMVIALKWMHENKELYYPILSNQFPQTQSNNIQTIPQPKSNNSNSEITNTVSDGSYSNAQYHFSVLLGAGAKVDANPTTDGVTVLVRTPSSVIPHLKNITVGGPSCQAGQRSSTVTVQGMSFLRDVGSGAYGGMESGSFDAVYCIIDGNFSYIFSFAHVYPRVGPNVIVPNETADLQLFDQELASLQLTFTN
jgi:hypothetical protein